MYSKPNKTDEEKITSKDSQELRKKILIDYICDHVFFPNREEITATIDSLALKLYKLPFSRQIYNLEESDYFLSYTHEQFSDIFKNKTTKFNSIKAYNLLINFLDFCYKDNLLNAILKRVNHVNKKYNNIDDIFERYEKVILINGELFNSRYHVVLTKKTFKFFLENVLMIRRYSESDFNTAFRDIQKYPNFSTFPKSKFDPFIYPGFGMQINRNHDELLVHYNYNTNLDYLAGYGFPIYPSTFINNAKFSDADNAVILSMAGSKMIHLAYLAKLTAAAYCFDNPLKVPTVFYSVDNNTLDNAINFISFLFNGAICELTSDEYISPELNLDTLAVKMFSGWVAFGIKYLAEDKKLKNIRELDGIRRLAKGTYIRGDDITVRNHCPIVIFTNDRTLCNNLIWGLDSNVIELDKFDNNFPSYLQATNFPIIRQPLTLFGLSELKKSNIKFTKEQKKHTLAENFFFEFIIDNDKGLVSKADLRNWFAEYLKKTGDEKNFKSIEICNELKFRGYNVKSKKRINGEKNPIAVVKGIQFDYEKFRKFIDGNKEISPHIKECNKIVHILKNVTPKFVQTPIIPPPQGNAPNSGT